MIENDEFRIMFTAPDQIIERRLRSATMGESTIANFAHALEHHPPWYLLSRTEEQVERYVSRVGRDTFVRYATSLLSYSLFPLAEPLLPLSAFSSFPPFFPPFTGSCTQVLNGLENEYVIY
jgi:hypothetical protein